jgi:hypothetical protein
MMLMSQNTRASVRLLCPQNEFLSILLKLRIKLPFFASQDTKVSVRRGQGQITSNN